MSGQLRLSRVFDWADFQMGNGRPKSTRKDRRAEEVDGSRSEGDIRDVG